ncbi:hypothetical protein SH467x_000405 [Pirellulaceae bacterium SH467]
MTVMFKTATWEQPLMRVYAYLMGCFTLALQGAISTSMAQEPLVLNDERTNINLSRIEQRLSDLEASNRALQEENARLHDQFLASHPDVDALQPLSSVQHTPGDGITISMLNDKSRLTFGAAMSALSTFSTSRQFSPSLPLLLFPASPSEQDTNTFGIHARQSSLNARFRGPDVGGFTPGGEIYTLFFNDNITDDNYGMLVYFAYGELKNDQSRFAAGIQKDIFNPLGPSVLPISVLYASGNSGSYRGQVRWERFIPMENGSMITFQGGLSEPIATLVRDRLVDPLVEDNGWPNLEGRLLLGFGEAEELVGGRKQRSLELGLSAVVGQIRITKPIPGPSTPGPDRIVDDIQAIGCDLQCTLTDRMGVKGEVFIGQTLAEYNAGALQNFNSETFEAIRSIGGFAELYYYLHPQFHVHFGYGIDDPFNSDLASGQISSNETYFTTAYWDVSKNVQFGVEIDYRTTRYLSPLSDADGFLFMNQFLWRF